MSSDGAKSYYIAPKICNNNNDNKGGHGYESQEIASLARNTKILTGQDLSKPHLQLWHGTNTAL